MYSKEYDRNLEISKIHHKRKEDENVKNVENGHENKKFRKVLTIGSIISISILLASILAAAAVTEIGSWEYDALLTIPPDKALLNNLWGAPYEERQSGSLDSYIYYKSDYSSFGWEWNRPNPVPMDGWIQPIFPEIWMGSNTGFSPIKFKDVNSLSAELQYTYPKSPTGDYNFAYDIWFTYGDTRKAEIMIWISCTECAPGTYEGEINDGYNTYDVYYTDPSSWRPWLYYAFVLKNRDPIQYNHNVNIKTLLDSISGKLNSDWSLSSLELGNEIYKGSGRIEISKYQINLNNAVIPTPTPTPTATPTPTRTPLPTVTTTPTPTPTPSQSSITVFSPNGEENWKKGIVQTIKWGSTGSPGTYVKIELLKGDVLNRVISPYTPNDGSYNWIIPYSQIVGTDYKVRITSTSNFLYSDMSNSNFGIYQYGSW